jgi:hypothetical protein
MMMMMTTMKKSDTNKQERARDGEAGAAVVSAHSCESERTFM